MMSTQRNESINAVIKRKIKSYNRTNFMRVIYVVREVIDEQYIEVNLKNIFVLLSLLEL